MHIGIPREIKPLEGRVALTPDACGDLVRAGHRVMIEHTAGARSGYTDAHYEAVGAQIAADAATTYAAAELIVKVKEPVSADLAHLRPGHLLFCYLHLAANLELLRQLQEIGLTAIGFETVTTDSGQLPLLAPMSDIAGRLASQIGAGLLQQPQGGKGLLLGGLPCVERGRVVILGAGNAGGNAAAMASDMGAEVVVFDRQRDRLAAVRALGNNVTGLYPYPDAIEREVASADLLIGAVLIPGDRAPHIVSRAMVETMEPGSVIVDISVDQGGCIETTRPTNYANPTYIEAGVVHFAVTNMPGAVPRSASQALSAALLPYVHCISRPDWRSNADLKRGINIQAGRIELAALRHLLEK
jgi:alanine dehydrogenase